MPDPTSTSAACLATRPPATSAAATERAFVLDALNPMAANLAGLSRMATPNSSLRRLVNPSTRLKLASAMRSVRSRAMAWMARGLVLALAAGADAALLLQSVEHRVDERLRGVVGLDVDHHRRGQRRPQQLDGLAHQRSHGQRAARGGLAAREGQHLRDQVARVVQRRRTAVLGQALAWRARAARTQPRYAG